MNCFLFDFLEQVMDLLEQVRQELFNVLVIQFYWYVEEKVRDETEDNPVDENEPAKSDLAGKDELANDLNDDQAAEQEDDDRPTARFEFHKKNKKSFSSKILYFRPRRLSELNIVEKVKPIPPYSSLFLFSHTNK